MLTRTSRGVRRLDGGATKARGAADVAAGLAALRVRIAMARSRIGVRAAPVRDYAFATSTGAVRLSQLFAAKRELLVVHLVGVCCPYSTLWADGLSTVQDRLSGRAAIVVTSPDDPVALADCAAARGWRFPIVSHAGTSFAADMGAVDEDGRCLPAVSVFQRRDAGLLRLQSAPETEDV